MKKHADRPKLTLSKQTVRALSPDALDAVVGAKTLAFTCTCPTTWTRTGDLC